MLYLDDFDDDDVFGEDMQQEPVRKKQKTPATMTISPPISASEQGIEIVTINVGTGPDSQTFKMHKNLLVKASKFLDGTLKSNFEESTRVLNLAKVSPVAFEVLYQYLYSGLVHEAAFYVESNKDSIAPDVLWSRVYKLADIGLIEPLQKIAYTKLRDLFKAKAVIAPTPSFITELYNDTGPEFLRSFIVQHVAYHVYQRSKTFSQPDWTLTISCNATFEEAVSKKLLQAHLQKQISHPTESIEFKSY